MTTKFKQRLRSNRKLRMPKPKDSDRKSFALRLVSEADSRFAVVKTMRKRIEQLKDDGGIETIQGEMVAARIIFLVTFLESQEIAALEGQQIEWGQYLAAFNAFTGAVNKIGLTKKFKKDIQTLETYVADKETRPLQKRKRKRQH